MMDPLGLSLENFDFRRQMAGCRQTVAPTRRVGHGAGRNQIQWTGRALTGAGRASRTVRHHVHGKNARLRAGPGSRALRHAGCSENYAGGGREQLQGGIGGSWRRQQSSISDAEASVMILRKMALPRRTFLRGLGATLALPLLDAMVPSFTPIVKTAAKGKSRLGFVYLPNGVAMNDAVNYWTPKGSEPTSSSRPSEPLSPFRDQVTVVSGLNQRNGSRWATGTASTRAGRILAERRARRRPKARTSRTAPPPIRLPRRSSARRRCCRRSSSSPRKSIWSSAANARGASCAYMNTISWRSPTTPLPVENNPSVVFERMFGEGGTKEERLERIKKKRSVLDRVNGDPRGSNRRSAPATACGSPST